MARCARVDVGDQVYHVINRAVGRLKIFDTDDDYILFEEILRKAAKDTGMRVLSYVMMPNHWHLQLYPEHDGDMGIFMHALTNTHTRRVHTRTNTVGTGPLYQGRYKSFLTENDGHLLVVLRYIERNPVRAGLSRKAEDWRWGSAWLRVHGTRDQQKILSDFILPLPREYEAWINTPDHEETLKDVRASVNKGLPYGRASWIEQMVQKHELGATTRGVGRPAKE